MIFRKITAHEWMSATMARASIPEDKFAFTFMSKANAMNLWEHAICVCNEDHIIMAGIIVRVNKRQPVANLQLLHTFSEYRRQGWAAMLVGKEFHRVHKEVTHFRVSAEEDAVPFYRALGFKFWGRQKSGSLLSMFRIGGPTIAEGQYDVHDPLIDRAIHTKARGGLVEIFEDGPC